MNDDLNYERRFDDVRECGALDGERKHALPWVDVIAGGFPCQDISNAGKRAGIDGERSGLWSEYARIIRELRPRYVVVENVAALLGRGMERVLGDLAACGYDAEWQSIRASDVGAPHRRERIWIVAYPGTASEAHMADSKGRFFRRYEFEYDENGNVSKLIWCGDEIIPPKKTRAERDREKLAEHERICGKRGTHGR